MIGFRFDTNEIDALYDNPSGTTLTTAFHHTDHLSGSNISTDATGNIQELNDYYPYGTSRIENRTGDYTNDYLFTGQERDEETDLYYYGARYYNPDIGRFTSLDPWSGDIKDPQSLNKYSYVRNNPLKYVDPSGEIVEVAAKDLELTDIIGSHSYLIITPLEPDNFQAYLAEGETSFTIGGFGVDDKLVGIINAKTDIKDLSSPRVQDHDVVDNPFGDNNDSGSDIEFINSILEIHNNAPEMDYNFASFNLNGRNCHNYTTSLIEGAGAEIPSDFKPTGLHPGLGESIPTMIDNSSTSSNNTDNPTNNANESDQGLWDKFKSLF